jgi:hypothetical protein
MEAPVVHQPGCVLDPVHWLRHAITAAGRLTHSPETDRDWDFIDRVSVEFLTDPLAHFAELPDWASVTLHDVAQHATPINDGRFDEFCNCGAAT